MGLFVMNNVDDVYKAIDEFDKVKPELQYGRALAIKGKLNQYDMIATVRDTNLLLNYISSDRLIIQQENRSNEFDKYVNVLKENIVEYNKLIYNDIYSKINERMDMYQITDINKKYNDLADALIEYYYPDIKDYIYIFKRASSDLFLYFTKGIPKSILINTLDDLRYIIYSEVLSSFHIDRRFLGLRYVIDKSLYTCELDVETLKEVNYFANGDYIDRIEILNTSLSDPNYFKQHMVNNKPLEDYLKLQKRNYEMSLLNSNISSDYKPIEYHYIEDFNLEQEYNKYSDLVNIPDDVTLFELYNMGFPVREKLVIRKEIDNSEINIPTYYQPQLDYRYMILSSRRDPNTIYFVNPNFKYKINLNTKNITNIRTMMETCDVMLESAMANIRKG